MAPSDISCSIAPIAPCPQFQPALPPEYDPVGATCATEPQHIGVTNLEG